MSVYFALFLFALLFGAVSGRISFAAQLTAYERVRGSPYTVSHDERAIKINDRRVLLNSGVVHYPRATPDMWPTIFSLARQAGLNAIQTYVFWNYHERTAGVWDFTTQSRNLRQFIQSAADHGLFVNLRFGPYVCAEFAHGGIPIYTRSNPNISCWRCNDPIWLQYTEYYLNHMSSYLQPFLPKNGGPIILAQIENEYPGGADAYMQSLADMAVRINQNMNIVWYANNVGNVNKSLIAAWDTFYPENHLIDTAFRRNEPGMVVETYPGWLQPWNTLHFRRPAEDHVYAIAKFVAMGGAYVAPYPFFGGTNYGRWSGALTGDMGYIPSYGYSAPILENATPNPYKFYHHAKYGQVIATYADIIISNPHAIPQPLSAVSGSCGTTNINASALSSYLYGDINIAGSVVFLINTDLFINTSVIYNKKIYCLPAFTVLIIDAHTGVLVFDTSNLTPAPDQATLPVVQSTPKSITWLMEPIGVTGKVPVIVSDHPLDQLDTADLYTSSYFWYEYDFTSTSNINNISISNANDYIYIYINDTKYAQSGIIGSTDTRVFSLNNLSSGIYHLQIVTVLMGVDNFTPSKEKHKGLGGASINVSGQTLNGKWQQQIGLYGETAKWFTGADSFGWNTSILTSYPSWHWYRLIIPTPIGGSGTFQLNMTSMIKGFIWVNGQEVSNYWLQRLPTTGCYPCHYTGAMGDNSPDHLCRVGCGDFDQMGLYYVPTSFLSLPGADNVFVFFEEQDGARPDLVTLQTWQNNEW